MSGSDRAPRVLLYGKDARTDALAAACAASSPAPELFAYSELAIPGLLDKCRRVEIGSLTDCDEMAGFAREVAPDLAVIGPEDPLAAGLADALEALGVQCFGPQRALARVEASKSWARTLLDRHGIPGNPRYRVFTAGAADGIPGFLSELGDFVVKPDGLTGGKGVRVSGEHLHSAGDALDYAVEMIGEHGCVVVEERLEGEEFSLQTLTDGESVVHCPVVQDHKRAREGDTGPNTGGMGSYSCPDFSLPFLEESDVAAAERVNEEVVAALARETGRPYRGVLYGGFMATGDGVRLVEYNARFGDPEAMNVLAVLATDFVDLCRAAATGGLGGLDVSFEAKATVCKYVVPEHYPEGGGAGDKVRVPDEVLHRPGLHCYWAATERRGPDVCLTGSRAIAFVGVGETLAEAEQRAEEGAAAVEGPVRHRSDIGKAEVVEARVRHMHHLR